MHDDDTVQSLAARVLAVEHRIYPLALRLVATGRVGMAGKRCIIEGSASTRDALIVPPTGEP